MRIWAPSEDDQGGIRRLCTHLLQSAVHGPELRQKAQEAKPRTAKCNSRSAANPLTGDQHKWLRDYVAKFHWRNLSPAEKEQWIKAPPPNTTTSTLAHNEPATASTPARATSTEPTTVSSEAAPVQPRKARKYHTNRWMTLPLGSPNADKTVWSRSCPNMLPAVTLLQPLQKPLLHSKIVSLTCKTCCSLLCQLTLCPEKQRNAASVLRSWQALGPSRSSSHQNPPLHIAEVRFQLDALLRSVYNDRSTVQALGFPIGRHRWGTCHTNRQDFFSKGDGPQVIELVQDRLQAHSQSSSRLCVAAKVGDKQEWQLVRTMTSLRTSQRSSPPCPTAP